MNTPLEECEKRDVKGLYQKAREGRIPNFTGVSSPYEEPENADIVIDTDGKTVEEAAEQIISRLKTYGFLPDGRKNYVG